MSPSEFSVRHPVSITMLIVIAVTLGLVSIRGLPIEMFPEIEFPGISVTTEYEGVGPEEIEERVTEPIEQAVSAVEDVKHVHSTTREGLSSVFIEFNWGAETDTLRIDVREKLDAIRSALPEDIEDPIISKQSFGGDPQAIRIAVTAESLPLHEVRRIAKDVFRARFESIEDVATVEVIGGHEREIQVNVSPSLLGGHALTLDHVTDALRSGNLNHPGGRFERGRSEFLLRTIGKFRSLDDIRHLTIANHDGAVVTIADVGEVIDTHKEVRALSRFNGLPTVELSVLKEAQGNALSISDAVRAQAKRLAQEYPELDIGIAFDSSPFIRDAVLNVRENATFGGFFAILVLWPFLSRRRWGVFSAIALSGLALLYSDVAIGWLSAGLGGFGSFVGVCAALALGALLLWLLWTSSPATLIVSIAMPVSIICTFVLIKFADLSLNVMSLGGLALGVGMLVDNSVVVIENIARHMTQGKSPQRAAVEGAGEVSLAIVVSTLTTLAVFLPIAWVEGIAREIFNDLSLTVSFSLITSLVVSITIVPMMAAEFLHPEGLRELDHDLTPEQEAAALPRPQARFREWLLWLLEKRRRIASVMGATIALFVLSLVGIAVHPKAFFPETDRDTYAVRVEMPGGTPLSVIDAAVRRTEEIIGADPDVKSIFASVRGDNTTVGVTLRKEDRRHSRDIQNDQRARFADIPDANIFMFNFHSAGGGRPIDVEILGEDRDRLAFLSKILKQMLEGIDGVLDAKSSVEEARPEIQIRIDRLKAADYGLSVREIAQAVETGMDGRVAGQFTDQGREADIRVRFSPETRRYLATLENLGLRNAQGVPTALKEVATIRTDRGPIQIERRDQRRKISVNAEKALEHDVAGIAREITRRMRDVPLPVGYTWQFGGDEERRAEAFSGLGISLAIAIVLVYMIMAALFESLMHPLVIMVTMPLALIGVWLGMVVFGQQLTVPAYVGVIMLAGVVVNNAIVLLDYVNRLRRRGLARREALALATGVRLRPVLMTAGTTVLGMLPMATGIGRGSEVFQSLAAAVVGGLVVSTFLTLLVIPCTYDVVDRIALRIRGLVAQLGLNVRDPYAGVQKVRPPGTAV